jgi:polysaccharide export outer membrane protein
MVIKLLSYVACLATLCLTLTQCSNPPLRGCDVLGADEFVIDSYKIREGKFSILEMEGKTYDPLSCDLFEEDRDLIQDGDSLKIMLYHPARSDMMAAMNQIDAGLGFPVDQGMVKLPDLEPIEVTGLSLAEAREKIQQRYSEQVRDVEIYVTYKERRHGKIDLVGLVETPNVNVNGKMRLFEVLSAARVPADANLFRSYVVRGETLLPVDLHQLIKEGNMQHNIVMRGGDKIYIASTEESSVMVLGEVGKESVVPMSSGSMTLPQAIARANGIPFTGDKSYIQVIRGGILHPKIYTLNWKHVMRLPSSSLLLIPGDIVYVAATPLTEWNRFVTQVLPTLVGFDLATKGIKSIGVNVP